MGMVKHININLGVFAPLLLSGLCLLASCRKDQEVFKKDEIRVEDGTKTRFSGFYLLNEGNMGSNKSTLDYFDFSTGTYLRNIYGQANPGIPKELGDVGNDIAIYGSRLYAVMNASNKIEVMDAKTAKRLGQIDLPNARYMRFSGRYAYITSYAGPIEINPDYTQKGFVAKVDTATLAIVAKCVVGFQPDGLDISGNMLYVANSGGYMGAGDTDKYERTVSVIDLNSFTELRRIDVAPNLDRVFTDKRGDIWVTSRGDYKQLPAQLFFIDHVQQRVTDTIPMAVSTAFLDGDSLYVCSTEWHYANYSNVVSYGIIDTRSRKVLSRQLISDGTDKRIEVPYGIMVHPQTKDIYITDAGNYVSPGILYCFSPDGKKKWSVRTGDIPAHFALLPGI